MLRYYSLQSFRLLPQILGNKLNLDLSSHSPHTQFISKGLVWETRKLYLIRLFIYLFVDIGVSKYYLKKLPGFSCVYG